MEGENNHTKKKENTSSPPLGQAWLLEEHSSENHFSSWASDRVRPLGGASKRKILSMGPWEKEPFIEKA